MSEPHQVEVELTRVVGMRAPKDRSDKAHERFRMDLLEKVDSELDDDSFDALSNESQEWINSAVEEVMNGRVAPDFSVVDRLGPEEDEPEDQEQEVEQEEEESEVDSGSPVNEREEEPEPDKPTSPPNAGMKSGFKEKSRKFFSDRTLLNKPKYPGAGYRAKEFLVKYGVGIEDEVIFKELRKEGLRLSPSTLQPIRYEFKQTLVILNEHGLLDMERFEKIYGKGILGEEDE